MDAVASWAAGAWCLPPAVVKEVEAIDKLARQVQDRMAAVMSLLGDTVVANDDGAEHQYGQGNDDRDEPEHHNTNTVLESDVAGEVGVQEGLDLEEDVEHPSPDLEDEAVGRDWYGESAEAAPGIEVPCSGSGASGTAAGGGTDIGQFETVECLVGEVPCLGSGASGTAAGGGIDSDCGTGDGLGGGGSGAPGTAVSPVAAPPAAPPPPEPGEMYEALVRQRPSRRIGPHTVVESGAVQWCLVCRAASHTGGLGRLPAECSFERVRASFAGDAARIQLPHDVVYIQGAVFCLRCGACSTSRLAKLAGARCQPSCFGAKELRRVLGGGLPSNLRRWPLALEEPGSEQPALAPGPARLRRCRTKTTPTASSS